MKGTIAAMTLALGSIGVPAHAALKEHYGKTITLLQASDSPCIYFQLNGVNESNPANPVVQGPSGIWFAIDKNQGNAKEMYALLLGAKLSGTVLYRVLTNGDTACGLAKTLAIDL